MQKIFLQKLSAKKLATFAKELSFLLGSGLPILKSLAIIEKQTSSKLMKSSILMLIESVSSGKMLSRAFELQNELFPVMFVNIIKAGEALGELEQGLSKAADYYDSKDSLKKKVISSITYPAVVLCVSLTSVVFILLFLIPMMNNILNEFGISAHPLMNIFILTGRFVSSYYFLFFLLFVVLMIFLLKKKLNFSEIVFKIPIAGKIARKAVLSRICSTLASLISSGVNLLTSLTITSQVAGIDEYKNALIKVKDLVQNGKSLSFAFSETKLFPDVFCEIVAVSESSGRLKQGFNDLADRFSSDLELQLKSALSLVEPASTILVGALVGLVVLSMFVPMMHMLDSLVK